MGKIGDNETDAEFNSATVDGDDVSEELDSKAPSDGQGEAEISNYAAVESEEVNSDNIRALNGRTLEDFADKRWTVSFDDASSQGYLLARLSDPSQSTNVFARVIGGNDGRDGGSATEGHLLFRTDGSGEFEAQHSWSGETTDPRIHLSIHQQTTGEGVQYYLYAKGRNVHQGQIIVQGARRNLEWHGERVDSTIGEEVYTTSSPPTTEYHAGVVSAEDSISAGRMAVPKGNTFSDIQELIDDPGVRQINLASKHYTGDSALVIEDQRQTPSKELLVNAYGAVLESTGDNDVLRIRNGDAQWARGIEWHGGSLIGPGSDVANSACVKAGNCYGIVVEVRGLKNAEHGIWARNEDTWCEGNRWVVEVDNNSDIDYLVRLSGGTSSSDETSGSVSHRNSEIYIRMAGGGINTNGKIFWQDHASIHGGHLQCRGFLPDEGVGMHVDGTNGDDVIEGKYTADVEFEFGDENATSILVESNAQILFINPRLRAAGTGWDVSGSARLGVLTNNGFKEMRGGTRFGVDGNMDPEIHGRVKVHPRSGGVDFTWDYPWQIFYEDDGSRRFSIGNQQGDFSLISHKANNSVRAIEDDGSLIPMIGDSFRMNGGAQLYTNDNGDICVDDENGNTINLSNL